jgi:hypothetical protein
MLRGSFEDSSTSARKLIESKWRISSLLGEPLPGVSPHASGGTPSAYIVTIVLPFFIWGLFASRSSMKYWSSKMGAPPSCCSNSLDCDPSRLVPAAGTLYIAVGLADRKDSPRPITPTPISDLEVLGIVDLEVRVSSRGLAGPLIQ